jgi:hypothetical protein
VHEWVVSWSVAQCAQYGAPEMCIINTSTWFNFKICRSWSPGSLSAVISREFVLELAPGKCLDLEKLDKG